jgi:hypothetical protein
MKFQTTKKSHKLFKEVIINLSGDLINHTHISIQIRNSKYSSYNQMRRGRLLHNKSAYHGSDKNALYALCCS